MEALHIQPDEKIRFGRLTRPVIFLGGSIDNGTTEDWQAKVVKDYGHEHVAFLNPRRENWNSTASDIEMRDQIYWELNGLEGANAIIIHFHPQSKAPISLLELGLFARHRKVVVVCSPAYWRFINVDVVCSRMNIPIVSDLDEGMREVIKLAKWHYKTHGGLNES